MEEILPQSIETIMSLPAQLHVPFPLSIWMHITRVRVQPTWLDWDASSVKIKDFFGIQIHSHIDNDMGFQHEIYITRPGEKYSERLFTTRVDGLNPKELGDLLSSL